MPDGSPAEKSSNTKRDRASLSDTENVKDDVDQSEPPGKKLCTTEDRPNVSNRGNSGICGNFGNRRKRGKKNKDAKNAEHATNSTRKWSNNGSTSDTENDDEDSPAKATGVAKKTE